MIKMLHVFLHLTFLNEFKNQDYTHTHEQNTNSSCARVYSCRDPYRVPWYTSLSYILIYIKKEIQTHYHIILMYAIYTTWILSNLIILCTHAISNCFNCFFKYNFARRGPHDLWWSLIDQHHNTVLGRTNPNPSSFHFFIKYIQV